MVRGAAEVGRKASVIIRRILKSANSIYCSARLSVKWRMLRRAGVRETAMHYAENPPAAEDDEILKSGNRIVPHTYTVQRYTNTSHYNGVFARVKLEPNNYRAGTRNGDKNGDGGDDRPAACARTGRARPRTGPLWVLGRSVTSVRRTLVASDIDPTPHDCRTHTEAIDQIFPKTQLDPPWWGTLHTTHIRHPNWFFDALRAGVRRPSRPCLASCSPSPPRARTARAR